jgi:putative transposase
VSHRAAPRAAIDASASAVPPTLTTSSVVPPRNDATTSRDSSARGSSQAPSQTTNPTPTSAPAASTSNARGFAPFFDDRFKHVYAKLWLPTATDSVALQSNWCSDCSKSMEQRSSFSKAMVRASRPKSDSLRTYTLLHTPTPVAPAAAAATSGAASSTQEQDKTNQEPSAPVAPAAAAVASGAASSTQEQDRTFRTRNLRLRPTPQQKPCAPVAPAAAAATSGAASSTQEQDRTIRTRNLRLHPTPEQEEKLRKMFDGHRAVYNKANEVHIRRSAMRGGPDSYAAREYKRVLESKAKRGDDEATQKLTTLQEDLRASHEEYTTTLDTYKEKIKASKDDPAKKKELIKEKNQKLRPWYTTLAPLREEASTNYARDNEWLKNTPDEIRDRGVASLVSAYNTAFSNLRNKNIDKFKVGFMKRRDTSQTIRVNARSVKVQQHNHKWYLRVFRSWFGTKGIKIGGKLPPSVQDAGKVDMELKITRNRILGTYELFISFEAPATTRPRDSQAGHKRVVALDPGVRKFQTWYSDDNKAGTIGAGLNNRLHRLALVADRLVSKMTQRVGESNDDAAEREGNANRGEKRPFRLPHNKRQSIRRAVERVRRRMRNIVTDLHTKTVHFLTNTFDLVLIPTFDVMDMVAKDQRRIRKKTVRQMLSFRHGEFKRRLLWKGESVGCEVQVVEEPYTSKTCGACGVLNNVGGSEVFKCKACGVKIDRDYNGARNIMLRTLTLAMV